MNKIFFALMILFASCGVSGAALFESGTKDAQPAVLYGKTSTGAIVPIKVDSNGIVDSSGGGGTISDDAYGAGWNGDTTAGASKNAIYDKIETLGSGASVFLNDSATTGKVTYVGCSDSIQTAITNATAGDTLILGSCTYSISTAITGNKALTIIGQGTGSTIIDSGTNNTGHFSWTADGLKMSNMSFRGSRLGNTILVDLRAATGTNGLNNIFNNLDIYVSDTVDRVSSGIGLYDTGGIIKDVYIHEEGVDWSTSGQSYGIVCDAASTMDSDLYLYVLNTHIENLSSDASGNSNSILRGIRFYNVNNGDNPNSMYLYVDNTYIKIRDNSTNAIEALHMQGARIYAEISNSMLDGYGQGSSFAAQNKRNDFRCDDGATCTFRNTVLATGFFQNSSGTVVREGFFLGSGIRLDASTVERTSSNGVDAKEVMKITGTAGPEGTSATTATGGKGAGVSVIAGAGGAAESAVTAGTGGAGGSIAFTSGAGGSLANAVATTATGGAGGSQTYIAGAGGATSGASTNNVGGAGGSWTLGAGAGGAATNGTGTNTGGVGGSIFAYAANGGSGATASGRNGTVFIGQSATTTSLGYVQISARYFTIAADDTTPDVRYSSEFITSANTGATAITDLDNPTVGQIVCITGGSSTNASTIADSGNFNLSAAMTLNLDDRICLKVQEDNDYVEISRVDN